jgi:hypothetical protein
MTKHSARFGRSLTVAGRATLQTTGPDLLQARSERREGDRRGGNDPRQVGADMIRIPTRSWPEATPWLRPTDRRRHGPTSTNRRGWSSCAFAQPSTNRQQILSGSKCGNHAVMKLDIEMLEKMVAAGASGAAVLAVIKHTHEQYEAKRAKKRPIEAHSKRNARSGRQRTRGGQEVDTDKSAAEREATLADTPRARLFREGKGALLTLNIPQSRAGGLIGQWLKVTNDDDQLVLATILKAQSLAVADAPSWILATLKGKLNERSGAIRTNSGADQSRSTAILAGVAAAAERRFGGGRQGPIPAASTTAGGDDPELFGSG